MGSLRTLPLFLVMLMAFALPCEAAKRSVHLFGGTYVFNFPRDFRFVKRLNQPEENRETVFFESRNRSIVISGRTYDASNTSSLISREAYMATMEAAKATNVIYVNDETDGGRSGSVMLGSCEASACLVKMSKAIDQKIWLNVVVLCDKCSSRDIEMVNSLANSLYQQIRRF